MTLNYINEKLRSSGSKLIFKFLGIALIIAYCFYQGMTGDGSDYKIFYEATKHFWETQQVYHIWYRMTDTASSQFLYSPFFLFLFYPFILFPFHLSLVLWHLTNAYFLFRVCNLVAGYLPQRTFKKEIIFLALFISSRLVLSIFERGQMNLFLLFCIFQTLALIDNKKMISAAFVLSISLIVKLIPLTLIPYLIYRKHLLTAIFTCLFSVSYLLIPSFYLGWQKNEELHVEWFSVINPTNAYLNQLEAKTDQGIHSLTALYAAYFINNDKENYHRRYLVELTTQQFTILLNVSRLLLIALLFYFLRSKPFKAAPNKLHELWEISYLLLCTVLIFPHQQKYAFVFILPAWMYLSYFYFHLRSSRLTFAIGAVVFLLLTLFCSNLFFGYDWKKITEYYKTITFAMFVLMALLIKFTPDLIERKISQSVPHTKAASSD